MEYHASRWDYTKQASNWHWDLQRAPEPGPDSFTRVCNFNGDWSAELADCMSRAVTEFWGTIGPNPSDRQNKLQQPPGQRWTPEEYDVVRAGGNPFNPMYDRCRANGLAVFERMAEALGLEEPDIKFDNQRAGYMLHTHFDNFRVRMAKRGLTDPMGIRRFAIMLSDYQLGQVFQLGTAHWTQWRAGDCITWDWVNMPHATTNMGWWDRPMIQITAYTTPKTDEVMKEYRTIQL